MSVLHVSCVCTAFSVQFSMFLFSFFQILDEVEKRRAISPALVQPFMRGIMEAPFPAPGRTITVKNFLPGSGTEVFFFFPVIDGQTIEIDVNGF